MSKVIFLGHVHWPLHEAVEGEEGQNMGSVESSDIGVGQDPVVSSLKFLCQSSMSMSHLSLLLFRDTSMMCICSRTLS